MFEQSFKNIDNLLRKDKGLSTEIDYVEQTSWLLFLKYLEDLEINKSLEAELNGKTYTSILDKKFTWSSWAYPQKADKTLDFDKAKTGDDLNDFVRNELFPYLKSFKQRAESANTLEYKIGEIFNEITNKFQSGYILRQVIDIIQTMRFQTSEEKHELSCLYEDKIQNMGNSGRNGGEYYTPRPLIRTIINAIKPILGNRIYDGALGSAGFLVEAFDYLKNSKELSVDDMKTLQEKTLFGKEAKPIPYIIGTMNTADRSVEALDSALRRRFSFEEMMPNPKLLESVSIEGIGKTLANLLSLVNQRIEILKDREHQIGHSYFMGFVDRDKKPTTVKSEELEPVFVDKIIPLLQEYFYGDYEKIQLILGDGFIRETKNSVPFAVKKPYDDIPENTFSIVEKPNMEEALRKLLNI